MATTLTLPSVRFVAQVNTGAPEAKANYKALAQRNALALEECPWHDAAGDAVRPSDGRRAEGRPQNVFA